MAGGARRISDLGLTPRGGRDPHVTGLAIDSRAVRTGFLFAALPGSRAHGADFIGYAVRMGAGSILTDAEGAGRAAEALAGSDVALVVVQDARAALAQAAALWSGAQPETVHSCVDHHVARAAGGLPGGDLRGGDEDGDGVGG